MQRKESSPSIFGSKRGASKMIDKRNESRREWWLNVDYTEELSDKPKSDTSSGGLRR
ncbi:hypothetical protein [Spongiibacter sp.]|uniref:hypothetical protein n=1 Tax=Spongiibacter sp. TaxID=2024860 RepID=UPI00356858CE